MAKKATDLAKPFDAAAFRDELENRVKHAFVTGLPEEMFAGLVEKSIKRLTRDKRQIRNPEWTQYNNQPSTIEAPLSVFDQLVMGQLEIRLKAIIENVLASEEWRSDLGAPGKVAEHVQELIVDNAGLMLVAMMGGAAQELTERLRQNIQNGQY